MACDSGRRIVCKWTPHSYAFVMELAAWRTTSSGLLGRLFGRDCGDGENAETRQDDGDDVPASSSPAAADG